MIAKVVLGVAAALCGGWMLFDGVHVMIKGKYFGPERPGPWARAFEAIGVDPFRLGPVFVTLGLLWWAFAAGAIAGKSWGWYGAVAVAVGSLWYLPVGTALSMAALVALWGLRG